MRRLVLATIALAFVVEGAANAETAPAEIATQERLRAAADLMGRYGDKEYGRSAYKVTYDSKILWMQLQRYDMDYRIQERARCVFLVQ